MKCVHRMAYRCRAELFKEGSYGSSKSLNKIMSFEIFPSGLGMLT